MEKFEPKNIKGASDFLPNTQIMRNNIMSILRQNFESYGFLPLETALLNYYDLLSYKYEDNSEILREIYKLKDQGERDLGLRFDLTVPFCKVISMNRNLRLPFKRYEIGKVFRNGPVKMGRTREFYQCDVDCVGVTGSYIEAELISLAVKCYLQIGIEPFILIGSRKLLGALIEAAGIEESNIEKVIAILDRLSKVRTDEIYKELEKLMPKEKSDQLISTMCMKLDTLEKEFPTNASVLSAITEMQELEKTLTELNIIKYCQIAPYLARGLNIYTGTVWEVFDKKSRISSSLGGGGRYDNIITNFIDNGQKYPAVGMSFGLEPICAVLDGSKSDNRVKSIDIMLVPMGTESRCQLIANEWREKNLKVLVYLGGKGVKKALEYANAEHIPYVAIIGDDEIKSNRIQIKDMTTGVQQQIESSDILQVIQK